MEFYEKIEDLLKTDQLAKIGDEFRHEENRKHLNDSSWDLATLFCNYLNKTADETQPAPSTQTLECIRELSLDLCQNYGNPKEIFLVFLENSEAFLVSDTNFTFLIDVMKCIFKRLENTNFASTSLELALRELNKYLKKVNSQQSCEKFLDFVEEFFSISSLNPLLTETLLNQFDQPLAVQFFAQLPAENWDSLPIFSLFKRVWSRIVTLNKDVVKLILALENDLKIQNSYDPEEDNDLELRKEPKYAYKITETSANLFFYFTLYAASTHNLFNHVSSFPLVYDNFYLLKNLLPISLRLLLVNEQICYTHMGLFTIDYFIARINIKTLDAMCIGEIKIVAESMDALFRLVIYSTFETIRKKSLQTVETYFKRLNREARYEFLKHFLNVYSGDQTLNNYLVAYLIYLFKEELNECFTQSDEFYFVSNTNRFKSLFDLIVVLKENDTCDIMQESSRIVACLNMLRFILLRDQFDRTNVFKLLETNRFLDYLEKSTQVAKKRNEFEYNNLKFLLNEDRTKSCHKAENSIPCFEVKTNLNESIMEPTNDERKKSLESALQKCDLIECLRVRINEIIRERKLKT
jgi:hypothetical protein